jgi:Bacterial membrane protein YfhO
MTFPSGKSTDRRTLAGLEMALLGDDRGPAASRPGHPSARLILPIDRDGPLNRLPYHLPTVVRLRNAIGRLRNPHSIPLAIIGLLVLAVNLPTLAHLVTTDPVQLYAGIQSGASHQALPGYPIIDPNAGYITQAVGHLVATDWLHGHVPWWNPYEGLGSPLAGEMQAAAFFPPVLLLQDAFGFVVFHVLLELTAGWSTYFLLRRVALGRAAATAGGVAFGLCGTLAWFEHAAANPIAFLPLALLGVERARQTTLEHRRHGWRLLAVALGLSIVSGFPETAYLDGLLVLVWAAVRLFSLRDRRRAMTTKLALGGILGVVISAPALVAFLDYIPHGNVGSHSGTFANGSLPIQNLAQTILPYGFGPIFGLKSGGQSTLLTIMWSSTGGYLDATLVVCALIGLLGARCRGLRIALAVWILAAMSKTFGVTWVIHLLNHLPGFHSVVFYRYSEPSWELAVIVLAAFGIDDMARRLLHPGVIVGAGVITCGAISWAGWQAWSVVGSATGSAHREAFTTASNGLAVVGVAVVVAGGLLAYARNQPTRSTRGRIGRCMLAGAVAVEAAVLFAVPLLSAPRPASTDLTLVHFLQRNLGTYRFATLGPIQPNFGSFFGLAELNVNDLPVPKAFTHYIQRSLDTNVNPLIFTGTTETDSTGPGPARELATHLRAYEAAGVKFVVTSASGTDVTGSPWPPVGLTPAPRRVYADAVADVWRLPSPAPFFATTGAPCTVRPQGEAAVQVTCSGPAVLHRLELSMPGWHVETGSSSAVIRSHGPFQSVAVGPGTTQVRFSFVPPYGNAALVAALIGVAYIVGSLCIGRSRLRRFPFVRPSPSTEAATP